MFTCLRGGFLSLRSLLPMWDAQVSFRICLGYFPFYSNKYPGNSTGRKEGLTVVRFSNQVGKSLQQELKLLLTV